MIAALCLLVGLSHAVDPKGRWHDSSNHLAFWTPLSDGQPLDLVGRELVLHPDQRDELSQLSTGKLAWKTGLEAHKMTVRGANAAITFDIAADGKLTVDSGPGTNPLYTQYPSVDGTDGRVVSVWKQGGHMVALRDDGSLVGTSQFRYGSIELVNVWTTRAVPLLLRDEQFEVVAYTETISGNVPAAKVFLLDRKDPTLGYVVVPVPDSIEDETLHALVARIRFETPTADWPSGSAPGEGFVTSVAPLYMGDAIKSVGLDGELWISVGFGSDLVSVFIEDIEAGDGPLGAYTVAGSVGYRRGLLMTQVDLGLPRSGAVLGLAGDIGPGIVWIGPSVQYVDRLGVGGSVGLRMFNGAGYFIGGNTNVYTMLGTGELAAFNDVEVGYPFGSIVGSFFWQPSLNSGLTGALGLRLTNLR